MYGGCSRGLVVIAGACSRDSGHCEPIDRCRIGTPTHRPSLTRAYLIHGPQRGREQGTRGGSHCSQPYMRDTCTLDCRNRSPFRDEDHLSVKRTARTCRNRVANPRAIVCQTSHRGSLRTGPTVCVVREDRRRHAGVRLKRCLTLYAANRRVHGAQTKGAYRR